MALVASGIKLPDALSGALGPINSSARTNYQAELDRLSARRKASQSASGRDAGIDTTGVIGHDIGAASELDRQNLDNALNNVLGNTGYANQKVQREYDQNEALARQVGALNKPSTLEEVLSGLGSGAQLGGALYGMNKKLGRRPTPGNFQDFGDQFQAPEADNYGL